ncbi:MAG TPA: hypothetical protein VD772_09245, partial [Anseongella sp.]|nr:hypothetical protein [Anseongella sp.]
PEARHLFRYLRENNYIREIEDYDPSLLGIFARDVIARITADEEGWEEQVPPRVAQMIKDRCLFDYPCDLVNRRKKINLKMR